MGMTQINVTLPETLQEYVEGRVEHGEFATPSEYLRELIRRDRDQRVAAFETEMMQALTSGTVRLSEEEIAPGRLISTLKAKLQQKNLNKNV